MPAAAVVAVAGVASAAMQADAASSAASTQANALQNAATISRAAAIQARSEILDRMVPALAEYNQGIVKAQDQIVSGSADIMRILQSTTGAADQLISSVGADAKRALLGSSAIAQGVPRQTFDQQYDNLMTATTPQALDQPVTRPTMPRSGTVRSGATPAYESTLAQMTGLPELTRDATGRLGTIADVRESTMAGLADQALTPAAQAGVESISGISPEQLTALPMAPIAPTATPAATTPTEGYGFTAAQQQLQRGEDIGLANLAQSTTQARQDLITGATEGLGSIERARQGAIADYTPYTEAGSAAMQREAALSGALGPQAQQEAINAFIESPGQKYLREQQEKALLRSASATGGLGGGRIRSALMEQAMNIAATQQQQQLENLRSIAGRGQQAAGDVAGIRVGTGTTEAGIQTQAGQQLAQLASAFGLNVSQLINMTSQEKAALAERTGINLSQLEQAIGQARVSGVQGLGSGLANVIASTTGDVAGLTERGATTALSGQQNLASILANLAVGAGSQAAQYKAGEGSALAAGQMAAGQAIGQGIQGLGNVAAYTLMK